MGRDDLKTLRQLLRQAVERLPLSHREIEDRLEIGHGNLQKLFNGVAELKVRQLLAIARLLQVAPDEILRLGCPETTAAATRRLSDWLPALKSDGKERAEADGGMPATREELTELVRQEIRRELGPRGMPQESE